MVKMTMIHNDTQENLVKFDYKLNIKVKFLKYLKIFLATCLDHIQKSRNGF